jgi:hypothetical protein
VNMSNRNEKHSVAGIFSKSRSRWEGPVDMPGSGEGANRRGDAHHFPVNTHTTSSQVLTNGRIQGWQTALDH